ncbi:hypothetical protein K1T71_005526 [Dendrolimus kikuchii]|uniref:Uncharacterized protein n=1 Tax=Dendrolimus kikuchii TaxID=765133 RepID=A0ACC1D4H5_9NEOP|nr:hypothetical protein K1T71_005526 [Dendrolimus kikuchii]
MVISCIFGNSHIKNTIIKMIPWNNITDSGLDTITYNNSWKCKLSILDKKQLERNKRSVNEGNPEVIYRVARSNETQIQSANMSNVNEHTLLLEKFKRLWPVWRWKQHGFFSDEYLDLINEHWLQFPPPSETLQKTLGSLYLLFSTVGCWGNVIVLIMYLR